MAQRVCLFVSLVSAIELRTRRDVLELFKVSHGGRNMKIVEIFKLMMEMCGALRHAVTTGDYSKYLDSTNSKLRNAMMDHHNLSYDRHDGASIQKKLLSLGRLAEVVEEAIRNGERDNLATLGMQMVKSERGQLTAELMKVGVRVTPVGVQLIGSPGQGKTVVAMKLAQIINYLTGHPLGSMWTRDSSHKFDDGYTDQNICLNHDPGISKDQNTLASVLQFHMASGDADWRFANHAAVEKKEAHLFVNRVSIVTTNPSSWTSFLVNTCNDPAAMARRFPIVMRLGEVKDEYAKYQSGFKIIDSTKTHGVDPHRLIPSLYKCVEFGHMTASHNFEADICFGDCLEAEKFLVQQVLKGIHENERIAAGQSTHSFEAYLGELTKKHPDYFTAVPPAPEPPVTGPTPIPPRVRGFDVIPENGVHPLMPPDDDPLPVLDEPDDVVDPQFEYDDIHDLYDFDVSDQDSESTISGPPSLVSEDSCLSDFSDEPPEVDLADFDPITNGVEETKDDAEIVVESYIADVVMHGARKSLLGAYCGLAVLNVYIERPSYFEAAYKFLSRHPIVDPSTMFWLWVVKNTILVQQFRWSIISACTALLSACLYYGMYWASIIPCLGLVSVPVTYVVGAWYHASVYRDLRKNFMSLFAMSNIFTGSTSLKLYDIVLNFVLMAAIPMFFAWVYLKPDAKLPFVAAESRDIENGDFDAMAPPMPSLTKRTVRTPPKVANMTATQVNEKFALNQASLHDENGMHICYGVISTTNTMFVPRHTIVCPLTKRVLRRAVYVQLHDKFQCGRKETPVDILWQSDESDLLILKGAFPAVPSLLDIATERPEEGLKKTVDGQYFDFKVDPKILMTAPSGTYHLSNMLYAPHEQPAGAGVCGKIYLPCSRDGGLCMHAGSGKSKRVATPILIADVERSITVGSLIGGQMPVPQVHPKGIWSEGPEPNTSGVLVGSASEPVGTRVVFTGRDSLLRPGVTAMFNPVDVPGQPCLEGRVASHRPGEGKGTMKNFQRVSRHSGTIPMPVKHVAVAKEIVKSQLGAFTSDKPLPLIEAVQGNEHLTALRMSTGMGDASGKKNDYFDRDPEGKPIPSAAIEAQFEHNMSYLRQGLRPPNLGLMESCLKDEILWNNKDARIFNGGATSFSLVIRSLLGPVLGHTNSASSCCAVGVNLDEPDEWFDWLHVFEEDRKILMLDYKKFDQHIPPNIFQAGIEIIYELAEEAGYSEQDLVALSTVLGMMVRPVIGVLGEHIQTTTLLASGLVGTSYLGSIVNLLMLCTCASMNDPDLLAKYRSDPLSLRLSAYGDDVAGTIKELMRKAFHLPNIARNAAVYNVTLTSPSKTEALREYYSREDLEFLARHFMLVDYGKRPAMVLRLRSLIKGAMMNTESTLHAEPLAIACFGSMCEGFRNGGSEMMADFREKFELHYEKFPSTIREELRRTMNVIFAKNKSGTEDDVVCEGWTSTQAWYDSLLPLQVSPFEPVFDLDALEEDCPFVPESQDIFRAMAVKPSPLEETTSACAPLDTHRKKDPKPSGVGLAARLAFLAMLLFSQVWANFGDPASLMVDTDADKATTSVYQQDTKSFAEVSNTNLVRVGCGEGVGIAMYSHDTERVKDPQETVGLQHFLSRQQQLEQYSLLPGVPFVASFDPWGNYWNLLGEKLTGFGRISHALRLTIVINANMFNYGKLIVAWIPFFQYQDFPWGDAISDAERVGLMQFPHAELDLRGHSEATLELSPMWIRGAFPINALPGDSYIGKLVFFTLNPLESVNGSVEPINVNLYGCAIDVEMDAPTQAPPAVVINPEGGPSIARKVRTAIKKAERTIGRFETHHESAAQTAALVGAMLGMTRADHEELPGRFIFSHPNMAGTEISDPGIPLTMYPDQAIGHSPTKFGLQPADMTNFDALFERQYFMTRSWVKADTVGDVIVTSEMTPCLWDYGGTPPHLFATRSGHVSQLFSYWRADIEIEVEVVCSALHRGVLLIKIDPFQSDPGIDLDDALVYRLDLSVATSLRVVVPWTKSTKWLYTRPYAPEEPNWFGSSALNAGVGADELRCNGILTAAVLNPLISGPDDTSVSVDINLYATFKNCEFAGPNDLTNSFTPGNIIPPVESAGVVDGANEEIVPEGAEADVEDQDATLTSCVAPVSSDDSYIVDCMGESVVGLKGIVQRYAPYRLIRLTGSTAISAILYEPFYPTSPGFKTNAWQTSSGSPFEMVKMTHMNWIASMFAMQSGSVRVIYAIGTNGGEYVTHADQPNPIDGRTEIANVTTFVTNAPTEGWAQEWAAESVNAGICGRQSQIMPGVLPVRFPFYSLYLGVPAQAQDTSTNSPLFPKRRLAIFPQIPGANVTVTVTEDVAAGPDWQVYCPLAPKPLSFFDISSF